MLSVLGSSNPEPQQPSAGTVRQGQHREENRNGNAIVGDVINWLMGRKRRNRRRRAGVYEEQEERGARLLSRLTSGASDVDQPRSG